MSAFPCRRGVNLGMWLSQADVRDERHLAARFSEDDVRRLAAAGADHIRLPVDHELIEQDAPPHDLREEGLAWVDRALGWAWRHGLAVILDLHKTAGMSFFTPEANRLWTDAALQARFARLWGMLARRYRDAPHHRLVFELLNEPTAADDEDWNRVAALALAAIRAEDRARWVVIGSNSWNVPPTFARLRDMGDPGVAYAVHWYEPFIFTHQKAPWCEWLKQLDLTVDYPAQMPDLSALAARLPRPEWREQCMLFSSQALGYERMERWFAPVAAFQRRSGAPIICTEFGCWDPAPLPAQLAWFADCLRLFAAHGVAWSQWEHSCLWQRDGTARPPMAVLFPATSSRAG